MRRAGWWQWACGFAAGAALASWLTLSCATSGAQSPEVAAAIHQAAVRHGVSEGWLLAVARCESTYRPWVTSRGGHMGLFQFGPRTWGWMSWQAGYGGASPYDPWAASQVAAWAFRWGYSGHWACA